MQLSRHVRLRVQVQTRLWTQECKGGHVLRLHQRGVLLRSEARRESAETWIAEDVWAHKVEPDDVTTEMELDADDEKEVDELLAPAATKIEDGIHEDEDEDEEVDELAYLASTSQSVPPVLVKLPPPATS